MATRNEENARYFASFFEPQPSIVKTNAVNGVPIKDAWTCSIADTQDRPGMTAIFFNGQAKLYIDVHAKGVDHAWVKQMAEIFAACTGRMKLPQAG